VNNSHDDHDPEELPPEISVTEVSDEVLRELSDLFGPTKGVQRPPAQNPHGEDPTEDLTEDLMPLDTATTDTAVTDSEFRDAEVISLTPDDSDGYRADVIVIGGDDGYDLTPAPADPLLKPLARGADVVDMSDDSGGTVVIDDQDLDRVVIVDDDRPDPRFDERQRRRERRERLKRVKWLKLGGLIVGLIVFVMGVLASPLFAIRNVGFEGVVYTSPATVEKVTNVLKGASVFTVDTAKAREQLLKDPWVSEVRITTDFPRGALVEIAERVPVVWYLGADQKARVVDARGQVITVLTGWPTKYLQVRGQGPSLEAGAVADDVFRAAAQLVLALPSEIRPKVKALDLTGGGELSMILKGGTVVRFGPPSDLKDKLVAVVVLFRRQDPATLAVVDVSTGEPTIQQR
jgi:cell division septal protein FtsQ